MRPPRLHWRRAHPLACQEVVELVTAYVEGTLGERDRRRFAEHLEGCDGCTQYVEQLHTTIRLTGSLNHTSLPAEMRERLLDAFRDWRTGEA
jgi:anti-sigma factor RsiW